MEILTLARELGHAVQQSEEYIDFRIGTGRRNEWNSKENFKNSRYNLAGSNSYFSDLSALSCYKLSQNWG